MDEEARSTRSMNRRQFLRAAVVTGSAVMVASAVPGVALASGRQVAAAQTVGLKTVPRNQTLVTVRGGTQGKFIEDQLWNPFIATATHQLGSQFVCEPLAFYSAFQDRMIMWLAESYQYSPDYMSLTIKTRPQAMWSDGVPFTADDVAYTYNSLNALGSKVKWGADVQQVSQLLDTGNQLRSETSNLVQALRSPVVRGQWGEIQLRRVVEMAGMQNYCDFVEQETLRTESGTLRPDLIVKLPAGKTIVVDAKAPVSNYLDAMAATDEGERKFKLQAFAKLVRDRITELGRKSYWDQFDDTPELVVMWMGPPITPLG